MPSVADRVKETTTTTGTGTVSLAGAATGFRAFSSAFATGTVVYYCITDGTNWEVGYGAVTTGTPWTLARSTVLASSNAGALVSFAAGSKDVFCTMPAAGVALSGANADITQMNTLQSINGGQLSGFRNKIINGDMSISQVNGATAVTLTASGYPIDQWAISTNVSSKLTIQQVVDAPVGFKFSCKISVAAQYAPAVGEYFVLSQPIEGQDVIDLGFGTASPATIAVSLYVKGSVAGTYACYLQNAGTRSYVGTITVTTAWAKQTVILVADNTGTWATDNTVGLRFGIDLGSGTNFNATAGAWTASNTWRTAGSVTFVNQTAGATLNITGVQLEQVAAGATAGTSFEHVSYADQLRRCQRYLPAFSSSTTGIYFATGSNVNTSTGYVLFPFSVPTRVSIGGAVVNSLGNFSLATPGIAGSALTSLTVLGGGLSGIYLSAVGTGTPYTAGLPSGIYNSNAAGLIYFTGAQM